ncbi:hypothetical protein MASR1M90_02530 [Desulfovibrionales bacterium]
MFLWLSQNQGGSIKGADELAPLGCQRFGFIGVLINNKRRHQNGADCQIKSELLQLGMVVSASEKHLVFLYSIEYTLYPFIGT